MYICSARWPYGSCGGSALWPHGKEVPAQRTIDKRGGPYKGSEAGGGQAA